MIQTWVSQHPFSRGWEYPPLNEYSDLTRHKASNIKTVQVTILVDTLLTPCTIIFFYLRTQTELTHHKFPIDIVLFLIWEREKPTLNSYEFFSHILLYLHGRHIWAIVCIFVSCKKINIRAHINSVAQEHWRLINSLEVYMLSKPHSHFTQQGKYMFSGV